MAASISSASALAGARRATSGATKKHVWQDMGPPQGKSIQMGQRDHATEKWSMRPSSELQVDSKRDATDATDSRLLQRLRAAFPSQPAYPAAATSGEAPSRPGWKPMCKHCFWDISIALNIFTRTHASILGWALLPTPAHSFG